MFTFVSRLDNTEPQDTESLTPGDGEGENVRVRGFTGTMPSSMTVSQLSFSAHLYDFLLKL